MTTRKNPTAATRTSGNPSRRGARLAAIWADFSYAQHRVAELHRLRNR